MSEDERTVYTDRLLEEKFITVHGELRALRDVPVAIARMQALQEEITRYQRESRNECREKFAELGRDAELFEAKTDMRFAEQRMSTRNIIIAFAAPVVTVLVTGACKLMGFI